MEVAIEPDFGLRGLEAFLGRRLTRSPSLAQCVLAVQEVGDASRARRPKTAGGYPPTPPPTLTGGASGSGYCGNSRCSTSIRSLPFPRPLGPIQIDDTLSAGHAMGRPTLVAGLTAPARTRFDLTACHLTSTLLTFPTGRSLPMTKACAPAPPPKS